MYTQEERTRVRDELLGQAEHDSRISGVAITGSAASGSEDEWSDIDLAFGVAGGTEMSEVLASWTAWMYSIHAALHHTDVAAGAWLYRVFLLPGTLQVDLAFAPESEFRAMAPTFRLVSGTARPAQHWPTPAATDMIGLGWLYALHARSCIARGRFWQAEYMISGVRDYLLTLACLRCGLPAGHGRGFDQLPVDVTQPLQNTLVRLMDRDEVMRAFRIVIEAFIGEIRLADEALAARLETALRELTDIR